MLRSMHHGECHLFLLASEAYCASCLLPTFWSFVATFSTCYHVMVVYPSLIDLQQAQSTLDLTHGNDCDDYGLLAVLLSPCLDLTMAGANKTLYRFQATWVVVIESLIKSVSLLMLSKFFKALWRFVSCNLTKPVSERSRGRGYYRASVTTSASFPVNS